MFSVFHLMETEVEARVNDQAIYFFGEVEALQSISGEVYSRSGAAVQEAPAWEQFGKKGDKRNKF